MSEKCDRVNHKKSFSSNHLSSNLKNPLLLESHKSTVSKQVIQHADRRRVIVKADDGKRIHSDSKNLFTKSHRSMGKDSRSKARRHLKRRRQLQEENDRSRSRKRRNISRSEHSDSQEESSSSSSSGSDIHATSPNVNRNILSRLVQYTFYSVINTGVAMDQGTTASALCKSFLALYLKLDESSVYTHSLDTWDKAGQKIIVLKGYNHKHLQYLAKEVRHIAVESNTLYKTTGRARVMLVLTAFGREEDMEEAFDDLCYLH